MSKAVERESPFSLLPGEKNDVREYLADNPDATVDEIQTALDLPRETIDEVGGIRREWAAGGSRLTNLNNSVNGSDAGISAADEARDIPTPAERVAEFVEEYPELAELDLTRRDGERLRREFIESTIERWESEPATERENSIKGEREVLDGPFEWGEAVELALQKYEETRNTTVNLERGYAGEPEYAEFSVDSETRWFASYQKAYFAQLKAWMRELTGGERPSGGSTGGIFDEPRIVLITRSASSVPGGDRLSPVDHAREIQRSWEPVYHTLRNTLRSLGFGPDEWQYERRLEPHTGERGGGVNAAFGHEHTIMVVDGPVEEPDFAPVLEKHVEECGPAGPDAHGVGDAVEVFEPDEVEDLAAYVASYAGIQPKGLLERKIEYIAWASVMDAANIPTKSRSDAANHASTADACKQRAESPKANQSVMHGEEVARSSRRGVSLECAECGSPHGIDQEQTLAAARLDDDSGQTAACDGGHDFEARRRNDLRERWEDARAAATVGETPTRREQRRRIEREIAQTPGASAAEILGRAGLSPEKEELVREVRAGVDRSEPVGFERAPSWRVVSVSIDGEEFPASAGNGVDMVAVDLSDAWLPPHGGGRRCMACGEAAVMSAREAREVHHRDVDGAYWCEECGEEFGPIDGPPEPPPLE